MLHFVSFFNIEKEVKNKKLLKNIFSNINLGKQLCFCKLCGKCIPNDILCFNCKKRIKKYEKNCLITDKNKLNNFLKCQNVLFDKFFYLYEYLGLIRKIMINYKFNNKSYYCEFFSSMILENTKLKREFGNYDIIIPVPMEKKKELIRGYNQTELITNIICKKNNIINGKKFINKCRNTQIQSTLNLEKRKENIKNAFIIKNNISIKGKKIIVFDDICTTGNTVNEISRILKNAGASEVMVIVLAKSRYNKNFIYF